MAAKTVKMWFDPEGDFLEVIFDPKPGFFRPTENDQVMEKFFEIPVRYGGTLGESPRFSAVRSTQLLKTNSYNQKGGQMPSLFVLDNTISETSFYAAQRTDFACESRTVIPLGSIAHAPRL